MIELVDDKGKFYKVTRRFPEFHIQETRFFRSKKKAEEQFLKWLQ